MKTQLTETEILSLYRGFFLLGDPATLKILYEIDRNGPKSYTELKNHLSLNPTTLSRRLKLLCKVELLQQIESDESRSTYALSAHRKQLARILDSYERLAVDMMH